MKIHTQETDGMQVHAGTRDEPCTFFDGESLLEAVEETGRWITVWDPVDVRENQ